MPQLGLGIIGNGTIASLIDIDGRQRWFCFPRLDGDPLFNALVNDDDPATGFMDVILQGATKRKQIYLRNTAVLETIIADDSGASIRIINFAPRFTRFGRFFCHPMLIRRIEPVAGRCPSRFGCDRYSTTGLTSRAWSSAATIFASLLGTMLYE